MIQYTIMALTCLKGYLVLRWQTQVIQKDFAVDYQYVTSVIGVISYSLGSWT